MQVHYEGSFNGVWINFEPLGLEMLSGRDVSANLFIQNAIETSFPKNWQTIYDLAFSSNNPYSNVKKLENFFLQTLPSKNKFEYIPFNKVSVNKVENLKDIHYMSYSSINRLYKNTLNISPKEFLNIQRFRRSVRQIHSIKRLTDIAYKEGYSDQSHMIRSFKQYTGISPKEFRKQSQIIQSKICFSME
jgi:AraC-like DNA-binding protein